LAEIIPYLLALWAGLVLAGINGAAVAFTMRVSIDGLMLLYFAKISKSTLKMLIGPGICVALSMMLCYARLWSEIVTLFAALVIILTLFMSWRMLPERILAKVKRGLNSIAGSK
jgi:hypothetical protein